VNTPGGSTEPPWPDPYLDLIKASYFKGKGEGKRKRGKKRKGKGRKGEGRGGEKRRGRRGRDKGDIPPVRPPWLKPRSATGLA